MDKLKLLLQTLKCHGYSRGPLLTNRLVHCFPTSTRYITIRANVSSTSQAYGDFTIDYTVTFTSRPLGCGNYASANSQNPCYVTTPTQVGMGVGYVIPSSGRDLKVKLKSMVKMRHSPFRDGIIKTKFDQPRSIVTYAKRIFVADHGGNILLYLPGQQRLYNHTNQKTPLLSSPCSKANGLLMPRAEDHCSKRQSLLRML